MTGEKNRYKTHEQLWKLEDGDLSTPQHDELVLQLMNKANAVEFIKRLGYDENCYTYTTSYCYPKYSPIYTAHLYPRNYKYTSELMEEFDCFLRNAHSSISTIGAKMFEEYIKNKHCPVIDVLCEVPLQSSYNQFIIGYVDVRYNVRNFESTFNIKTDEEYEYKDKFYGSAHEGIIKVRPEGQIKVSNKSLSRLGDEISINIEVKPKIKSFGETMRQINTYKEFDKYPMYVIYSPDVRFKAAFESQGVKFITPSDLGIN